MSYEEEDACMSYEEEDTCMSYEEEDACMSYEEEDACMSYEEEDACMSYEEEDTCMSYEEEDTCRASPVGTGARNDLSKALSSSAVPLGSPSASTSLHAHCKFNACALPMCPSQ